MTFFSSGWLEEARTNWSESSFVSLDTILGPNNVVLVLPKSSQFLVIIIGGLFGLFVVRQ